MFITSKRNSVPVRSHTPFPSSPLALFILLSVSRDELILDISYRWWVEVFVGNLNSSHSASSPSSELIWLILNSHLILLPYLFINVPLFDLLSNLMQNLK